MSALAKVAGAFQSKGYSRETRINQHVFYQLLDDMLGEPFDRDVANELWEQAELNSRQEAEVDQLCSIILQAQGILVDKINELTQKITDLQVQKRQRENDPSQRSQVKSSELKQLNDQIGQLERDCDEYREDLELVTSPFGINQQNLLGGRRTVLPGNPVDYHDYSSIPHSQILSGTPNDELKWMLWLTLGLLTLELFMMYTKYDFLNLLVLVIILSIFLLNYFDTVYIKICMGLTSISIVLDLIWLMAYAGDHWSPPLNGIYSQNQTGTLRFIVLFTIVMMCAKVPLVYLLFQYRQVQPNSTYTISLLGYAKLHLTANKQHNPFTSSLGQIV